MKKNLFWQGIKALEEFIDSIKSDVDRQMPKDGTVHELTSNVSTGRDIPPQKNEY